jgi:cleavage and polyadenylation specificity factor subunit 1
MHPKLSLVFSSSLVSTLPTTLVDSFDAKAMSMPEDPPRQAQTTDVSQIVVVPFGEGSSPEPHLFVFLRSGHLAIYSLSALATLPPDSIAPRPTLLVRFVHQFTRIFEVAKSLPDETTKAMPVLPETRRAPYTLIPFVANAPGPEETTLAGVFLTGDVPSWILRTDHSGIVVHPAANAVVYAFTACPIEAGADTNASAEFLMYTDEGPCLVEWVEDMELGTPLPSRRAYKERSYSHVVYEPSSDLVIAAAQLSAQFGSYDEDGNVMWEPDGERYHMLIESVADSWQGLTSHGQWQSVLPSNSCHQTPSQRWTGVFPVSLVDFELTSPRYEFATNEFVTAVELVSLETNSHESGYKEFIAVATTIDRGEDLAVKGAVYIFDIAEVVPDRDAHQQRWYKLRLLCRDDVKGPVTCLCGLNGYLVSSMGQKVRIFITYNSFDTHGLPVDLRPCTRPR